MQFLRALKDIIYASSDKYRVKHADLSDSIIKKDEQDVYVLSAINSWINPFDESVLCNLSTRQVASKKINFDLINGYIGKACTIS